MLKKIGHVQNQKNQQSYQILHQLVAQDLQALEQSTQAHEKRLSVKAKAYHQAQTMNSTIAMSPDVLKQWQWQRQAESLTRRYQTAFEHYQAQVTQLNTLHREKLISIQTFNKAMADYHETLSQAVHQEKRLTSQGLQCFDKLKEASLT